MPSSASDGCESSASCMCGSNGAVGLDLDEALARERVGERAVDEPDALLELRLLVLGRGLERPLEVVEHRQELA